MTVKILQRESGRPEGSVLLITLLVALGLGVVLASYLLMIRAQYVSVVRSQAWHSALTMAEAGVEEALAQLNSVPFTNGVPAGNGWVSADGLYQLALPRTLLGGEFGAAYTPNLPPTIYATGYATVPTISATIERVLEVKTTVAPLFSIGAAVRGAITMNGKDLIADSYDSTDQYYSGPGGVYDPSEARENGDIGSVGGILNADNLEIHGRVFLGAAATNVWAWNDEVTGATVRDFNADFPEVEAPFESSERIPQPGNDGPTNYTYALQEFNYQTNYLNGSVFVTNNANAVLYVTGNANITSLVVAPGASLTLYIGGGSTTFGQVVVSGTATNFQYYGLPGNTNITMIGHDRLTGIIYAPNARFRGGERSPGDAFINFDLYGAIIADSIDLRSDFRLHFDESLKNAPAKGPARGFVVSSWQELPPP
jgi:hypothetical protein